MASISRLPDGTSRLIRANINIVNPVSVVKELLDNAIDAKATSIEIFISPNTISKIEVRDNGVGIHPDDYDALGRPGHTSKLRNIEELGSVVGTSLGFRGEALASVNSIATVTITTKTSSEPVAAVLKLVPDHGGVASQRATSAPVGTAVDVTNLFSRLPVREQANVKEAKKNLERIQALLQSYAMARPQIKLFFKIRQTPTKLWSYCPKRNTTIHETALQLFGTDLTSNCVEKVVQANELSTGEDDSVPEVPNHGSQSYILESLLFAPDGDPNKIPKKYCFSVDGRPINASRGTAKKLRAIYLEHLRSSSGLSDLRDSFIRLDIKCPPATYDANIEPAKDEVLFSDEQIILDTFRRMCSELYKPGQLPQPNPPVDCPLQQRGKHTDDRSSKKDNHMSVGLGDHRTRAPTNTECARVTDMGGDNGLTRSNQRHALSLNADKTINANKTSHSTDSIISFTPINHDRTVHPENFDNSSQVHHQSMDYSHQEVNTQYDLYRQGGQGQHHQGATKSQTHSSKNTGSGNLDLDHRLIPWDHTKTKRSSQSSQSHPSGHSNVRGHQIDPPMTPEPPILRHPMAAPGDLEFPGSRKFANPASLGVKGNHGGIRAPSGPFRSPLSGQQGREEVPGIFLKSDRSSYANRRQRNQLPWTPPSSAERVGYVNRMPTEPSSLLSQTSDGMKQSKISFAGHRPSRRIQVDLVDNSDADVHAPREVSRKSSGNEVDIRQMLPRAQHIFQHQTSKENRGPPMPEIRHQRPHIQARQSMGGRQPLSVVENGSKTGNQIDQDDQEPIATTLTSGDPRAYLLRRQKSVTAKQTDPKRGKLRRVKSSLMPLETIPLELQNHHLSFTINMNCQDLDIRVQQLRSYDEYVKVGDLVNGLDINLSEAQGVESRLQELLSSHKENVVEGGGVDVNLRASLKGKGVAT
ncbi:hypothetical protein F5Y16DRAFT_375552 [Xylariaceae sp. FL0255]|nr:hypothetical protein F5Y16DRAFT_375552 [Xylariaceae sp. FL0255]